MIENKETKRDTDFTNFHELINKMDKNKLLLHTPDRTYRKYWMA